MKASIATVLVIASLISASAVAAEKIYRWVDEQGGVHFSAAPPPGQAAQASDLRYQQTPDPEAASERLQQYDDSVKARREQEQQAATEAADAQKEASEQARRCEQARGIVERLQNGRPGTRYVQEDGSYARYADEEREQKIADAQEVVDEACN